MFTLSEDAVKREAQIAEIKKELLTYPIIKSFAEDPAKMQEADRFFKALCRIPDDKTEFSKNDKNERLYQHFLYAKSAVENLRKLDDPSLSENERKEAAEKTVDGINKAMKTGSDNGNIFFSFTSDLENKLVDSDRYDELRTDKNISFMFCFGQASSNILVDYKMESISEQTKKAEPIIKKFRTDSEDFSATGAELFNTFAENEVMPTEIDAEIKKADEFIEKTKKEIEHRASPEFKKNTEKLVSDAQKNISDGEKAKKEIEQKIIDFDGKQSELNRNSWYVAVEKKSLVSAIEQKEKAEKDSAALGKELEQLIPLKGNIEKQEQKVSELNKQLNAVEGNGFEKSALKVYNARKKRILKTEEFINKLGEAAEAKTALDKRRSELFYMKNEFARNNGRYEYTEGDNREIDKLQKEYKRDMFALSKIVKDAVAHYESLDDKLRGDLPYSTGAYFSKIKDYVRDSEHEFTTYHCGDMKKIMELTLENQKKDLDSYCEKAKDFFGKYRPIEKQLDDASSELKALKSQLSPDFDEILENKKSEFEKLNKLTAEKQREINDITSTLKKIMGSFEGEVPTGDEIDAFVKKCRAEEAETAKTKREFRKNNSIDAIQEKIDENKKIVDANSKEAIEKRDAELKNYLEVAENKSRKLAEMKEDLTAFNGKFNEMKATQAKLNKFSRECLIHAFDDNIEEMLSVAASNSRNGTKVGHKNSPEYISMNDALYNALEKFSDNDSSYADKVSALHNLKKQSMLYLAAKKNEFRPIPSNMRKIRLERAALLVSLSDRALNSCEKHLESIGEIRAVEAFATGKGKFNANIEKEEFATVCDKAIRNNKSLTAIVKENAVIDNVPARRQPVQENNAPAKQDPLVNYGSFGLG